MMHCRFVFFAMISSFQNVNSASDKDSCESPVERCDYAHPQNAGNTRFFLYQIHMVSILMINNCQFPRQACLARQEQSPRLDLGSSFRSLDSVPSIRTMKFMMYLPFDRRDVHREIFRLVTKKREKTVHSDKKNSIRERVSTDIAFKK
eukprot:scaffold19245_cov199-Amphora_coffeaeformis.AAC.37